MRIVLPRSGRLAFLLCLTAASGLASPIAQAQSRDLVVFATASMKDALDEVAGAWMKETGKKTAISYAASPALARQIEQGAPADLFISADVDWMDYLQRRNLIKSDTRANLAGNRVVLVAPGDSTVSLTLAPGANLAGALGNGRLAMADVVAVPAGKYGKAGLEALGLWAAVGDRIAQAENVRAALLLVSRGEAPLGVVYQTDAAADPKVRVVAAFPENSHPPIVYPMALTATSSSPDAAGFLAYLKSAQARPMLEKQGFTPVD